MVAKGGARVGSDHKVMLGPLIVWVDAFVRAGTFERHELVASFMHDEATNWKTAEK